MNKDAYYFPHFSNARNDRKLRRVRKELGVEGYGIYFMLLETLRDQDCFSYPMDDVDLLADEFGTSEQKIGAVIANYGLFQINEEQRFFSLKFVEYLEPYLTAKHRNMINGIKGNLIKYNYITKEQAKELSETEILELNDAVKRTAIIPLSPRDSGGDSGGDRNKRKEKEMKLNESKVNESKEEENKKPTEQAPRVPYQQIMDAYNLLPLSNIIELTDKRKKDLARVYKKYGKDAISTVFNNINNSGFLIGENDRGWKADFDWIFKASNFIKILEGRYENTKRPQNEDDTDNIFWKMLREEEEKIGKRGSAKAIDAS